MRPQIVHILALGIFLFNGMQSFAQSTGPPTPNPNRTPTPPIELSMPIDDNIVILLVAGVLLGVYYICTYTLRIAKKKTA